MKIILTDNNGTYSIERETCETLHDVFEDLIIPVLNAAGFTTEAINRYMEED